MKVSLKGLISNAGDCLRASREGHGGMYAYCLEELEGHIRGLVNGEHTIEEFATHYCIERAPSNEKEAA